MKKNLWIFLFITLCTFPVFTQEASSQSIVDWTKKTFESTIDLDVNKSGIRLPAGRSAAQSILNTKIPVLIKDPLLSLSVDSDKKLGDKVFQESISMEQITSIVEDSKKTPPYYVNERDCITVNHEIKLNEVSASLIKHSVPYSSKQTIKKISSRVYTGIIIDARGLLPVQGEFVSSKGNPCFFPKIWNENMDLVYEKNMEESKIAKSMGVVSYHYSTNENLYEDRIGTDPLRITAKKIFGNNRTDPVISEKDALKILSVAENKELLRQGKVVILLDKPQLIYAVSAPEKNESFYVVYRDTENFFYERKVPKLKVTETYKGIQISIQDLKFMADSSELLPEEKERLDLVFEELLKITSENEFSILIEGHTASVGKPIGEMNLSVERAKTVINEFVKRGMNKNIFTYKGYGGTIPVEDNSTEEGRAKNRRVEITLVPKATYIQRR
ncbi:MAG: OmpA family protein [Treponemataceae bacterium]